jgi:hypothetical protein
MSHWQMEHLIWFHFGLVSWHLHHYIRRCKLCSSYVCGVSNIGFKNDTCVYSIRSGSWIFLTIFLLLRSWACLPTGLSVTQFSLCLFSHPTLMLIAWSDPFLPHGLPRSTYECEALSRCPSCWFFALFQRSSLCRSPQHVEFSFPTSANRTIISEDEFAVRAVATSCWNQQSCSSKLLFYVMKNHNIILLLVRRIQIRWKITEIFSAPYSAVLPSNVCTNVNLCLLIKRKWGRHPTHPYFKLSWTCGKEKRIKKHACTSTVKRRLTRVCHKVVWLGRVLRWYINS